MTKNPGVQIVKSFLLIRCLTRHGVYNISTTGVIVLSNEMNIDARVARDFIFKLNFSAWPRLFTLHSLVARQHELSCDISKK